MEQHAGWIKGEVLATERSAFETDGPATGAVHGESVWVDIERAT